MITIDSNVLVYALDTREPERRAIARRLILRTTARPAFLTQQVIGEFCSVMLRKGLLDARAIRLQVEDWANVFRIVPTLPAQLLAAADLAESRRTQFWDMVIVRVAADAGATVLFSEDIGDGEVIASIRLVDPFDPANAAAVDELLASNTNLIRDRLTSRVEIARSSDT